jgi:ATP-dependent Clp protease protease subunit
LFKGQAADIENYYSRNNKLRNELYQIFLSFRKSIRKSEKDSDRDYWMTAEEAKAYGMIDEILSENQVINNFFIQQVN